MKKLFVAAAIALLPFSSAFSLDFNVGARVDYPLDYNVYTFLDGEIGEHVSYSFANHWVSKDTKSLYQNTWRSWDVNWCDWANITLTFGGFSLTAGKDMMLTGLNEEQPNDIDNYKWYCSAFWNSLQIYQWGAKAAYDFEAAHTRFEVQFTSSPFDEKPFEQDGALSFGISGEYGFYHPYLTANFIRFDNSGYSEEGITTRNKYCILSLGNLFTVSDDLSLSLDWVFRPNAPISTGNHLIFGTDWRFHDHLGLKIKGGYEWNRGIAEDLLEIDGKNWFAGAILQWYPLKSDDLRIHAAGGYNKIFEKNYFTVGITYNLCVSDLFKK